MIIYFKNYDLKTKIELNSTVKQLQMSNVSCLLSMDGNNKEQATAKSGYTAKFINISSW